MAKPAIGKKAPDFKLPATGDKTVKLSELKGKKVLILVEDLYEDLEGWYPKLRLIEAGAEVVVAGPEKKTYNGKNGNYPMPADCRVDEVNWHDFDAVIIPGGYAPDRLRQHEGVLKVVKAMGEWRNGAVTNCNVLPEGRVYSGISSISQVSKSAIP